MIDGIYQCVDTLDLVYSSIAKAFHGNMSLQISNVKDLFDRSTFPNLLIIWNHIHFRRVCEANGVQDKEFLSICKKYALLHFLFTETQDKLEEIIFVSFSR